eukprot:scaffold4833_cov233-Amphora_coffeaeformis.AAC.18
MNKKRAKIAEVVAGRSPSLNGRQPVPNNVRRAEATTKLLMNGDYIHNYGSYSRYLISDGWRVRIFSIGPAPRFVRCSDGWRPPLLVTGRVSLHKKIFLVVSKADKTSRCADGHNHSAMNGSEMTVWYGMVEDLYESAGGSR